MKLLLAIALLASIGHAAEETETTSVVEAATPWSVRASSHSIFSNSRDELDTHPVTTNQFMHEGNVALEYGSYQAGIDFTNRFMLNADRASQTPFNLEKKSIGANWGNLQMQIGDTHQELGRGIALALYRDNTFGVDNTLEGASFKYQPEGLELKGFAGRVNGLKSAVAINPLDNPTKDREFIMGGGALTANVLEKTKLGAHYLFTTVRPLEQTRYEKRWNAVGATLAQEELFDAIDVYAETNILYSDRLGATTESLPTGHATYASLSYSPESWKLKLEGKDYRDYQFEFRRPPSLEEDIVETINTEDVSAARLQVERQFEGASVSASYLTGDERVLKSNLHHVVLGTKIDGPAKIHFEGRAGHRWLPNHTLMWHGLLKAKIPTFKGQALELTARKQYTQFNLNFSPAEEDRNMYDVSYTFSERVSTNVGVEYLPTNELYTQNLFLNAGATYKSGSLATRAFVGKTSGGTQCSGGVCRQVPPYTGAMIEATYLF